MPKQSQRGQTQGKQSGTGGAAKVRPVDVRPGLPQTKVVSPSGASSIGRSKGNHVMDGGRTVQRPPDPLVAGVRPQVPSGNEVALNVGRGGPGAGRTVSPCGSQGQWGPANSGLPPITPTPGGGPAGHGFTGKGKVV